MNDRTLQTLEVGDLVRLLARHVQTPLGRERALALTPSTTASELNLWLDLTTQCALYLASGAGFGLSGVEDPAPALSQLQIEGARLEPREILELQRLISIAIDLREQFSADEPRHRYPQLYLITSRIPDLRRVLAAIRGKILPHGDIDDNARPGLRQVRTQINESC